MWFIFYYMTHGSLFSGIGGFDLAAEWMGWQNVFHCEWNAFGQRILKYYWPNAISYNDITKTDFTIHRGRIDILTGGFPCQPYSMAGKRLGNADNRHLWPEMLRVIREVRPTWIVGENVLGLVNWSDGLVFHEVQTDLEAEGYEVQPYVLPAAAVGAPHRRDRVWFVAHAKDIRWNGRECKFREKINQDTTRFSQHRQERSQMGAEPERRSKEWILTDTDLHGRNERNGEHEIHTSQRWINAQRDILHSDGDGDAADSDSIRLEQCKDTTEMGNRQGSMGQERNQSTYASEADGEKWDAPDSTSQGREEWQQNRGWQDGKKTRTRMEFRTERLVQDGDAADTGNKGLQGSKIIGGVRSVRKDGNKFSPRRFPPNWDKFPTQSPICDGNDGISDRLDGITFSKWRQESIKAGGNAVVPQVVLQIFRTIEEYEKTHAQ
jgi:DNA (cytosine-5)-methyltransferase 1